MSSLSSKTEHRSRGDNREQKVQGSIAVVAPPFPPFPAICSQKRHAIKDRHLLPVSLALQLPHTNTLLPGGTQVRQCFTSAPSPGRCRYGELTLKTVSSVSQVTASSSQPQGGCFQSETSYFSPVASTHVLSLTHSSTVLHIRHSGCRGSTSRTLP